MHPLILEIAELKVRDDFLEICQVDFKAKTVFHFLHLTVGFQQQGQVLDHAEFACEFQFDYVVYVIEVLEFFQN